MSLHPNLQRPPTHVGAMPDSVGQSGSSVQAGKQTLEPSEKLHIAPPSHVKSQVHGG
jgi:hypothetical protein